MEAAPARAGTRHTGLVQPASERLFVREAGPAQAPTIVFLHGGGVSGWSWQAVVERLPDFHTLVPDLPEHGRSRGAGPFDIPRAAGLAAELIAERAHRGRAVVVGLSLGGQVAVQLLGTTPEPVERAIVSGALLVPMRGRSVIGPLVRLYQPFRNIRFLVRANMRANGLPARNFAEVAADTRALTAEGFARILAAGLAYRPPSTLRGVAVPVLALAGEREPGASRQSARLLAETLPRAEGRLVRGMGHAWPLQAPDLCARVVRAWARQEPLPDALVPLR